MFYFHDVILTLFPTRLFPPPSFKCSSSGRLRPLVCRALAAAVDVAEAVAVVLALAVTMVLNVAVTVTVAMAVVPTVGQDPSPSCQCSSRRGCRPAFFFAAMASLAMTVKVIFFNVVFFYPTLPTIDPLTVRQHKYCLYFGFKTKNKQK